MSHPRDQPHRIHEEWRWGRAMPHACDARMLRGVRRLYVAWSTSTTERIAFTRMLKVSSRFDVPVIDPFMSHSSRPHALRTALARRPLHECPLGTKTMRPFGMARAPASTYGMMEARMHERMHERTREAVVRHGLAGLHVCRMNVACSRCAPSICSNARARKW